MKTAVFANAVILAGVAAAQLRLPLVHRPLHESSLGRREVNAQITADLLRYSVNVTVGTPPQELSLDLSLDSQESWVPDGDECDGGCEGGSYNFTDSSTYDNSDLSYFSIRYGDGTSVYGFEFTDMIRVGGIEVEGLTMGLARNGAFDRGELAIGPSVETNKSIVEQLIEGSVMHSAAFSFWLDEEDGSSGNLLFGAVDTSAFDAPLQRISTHPAESAYIGFPVDFSILNYTDSSGGDPEVIAPQNDLPLILIRPTDMLTNFPSSIAKKIWHLADATYDKSSGFATSPCSGSSNSGSELILGLGVRGNATVRVSFQDLIIPHDIAPIGSGSDEDTCVFAIQSASSTGDLSDEDNGPWAIGGVVLRNTYIAFDLVNDEVAFAPVRPSSRDRNGDVVPFPSYGAEIPHSENADPISASPDYPYHDRSSPALGISAIVLMILGLLLILAGFITLLWFCWYRGCCCWRSRKKANERAAFSPPQSGPISEKVVYAGALPPVLPPRPVQAKLAHPLSGELPLGCAWIPAPVPYAMPVGSTAPPTETRSGSSDAQPTASTVSPVDSGGPKDHAVHVLVDPPASPSAEPSTRPPSPAGARAAVESVTPAVADSPRTNEERAQVRKGTDPSEAIV